ncbi:PKHS1 protein, partial [Rostratula benghalensis]|nr:PKHS1 protein [Rostratula benghalensis]
QNTFCPEGGVCKHGFLIKSPPLQLFNSQNSWKRRFFILSKSSKGNYVLKYLKGQNIKGSIAVDQIINIEVGISNSEIMETVRKMFKCLPEQVMSVSTGNRRYYLIGSSRWAPKDVQIPQDITLKPQGKVPLLHSHSHPFQSPPVQEESTCFFCIQESGPSEEKNRPNSDPGLHQAPRGVHPSQVRRTNQTALVLFSLQRWLVGKSEENLLSSDTDEEVKQDEDDYYQTPSSILAKVVYHCQFMCRHDELPSPPKCQDNGACPRDIPESSISQQPALQRRQNSLPLSVVQLSILLGQVKDETLLQKLDISIPLTDINSYLKLTEAAGQI